MKEPRRSIRVPLALAASLVLHALLLLLLRSTPPARAPLPTPIPIQVVILHTPPPPSAPAPAVKAATPARPQGKRRKMDSAPPPAVAALPAVPEVGPGEQGVGDAPQAVAGAGTGRGLALVPNSDFALTLRPGDTGDAAGGKQPEPRIGAGLHAPETPKDVVADTTRHVLALNRAELGLSHPYFTDVGKTLQESWHGDREPPPPRNLAEAAQRAKERAQTMLDVWQDRAAVFGKGGSPIPDDTSALRNDRNPLVAGTAMMQGQMDWRARSEGFKAVRRAKLRVIQDETGRIITVELIEPSSNPQMDREALADIRAAASQLPPPPLELLDPEKHLVSLWAFELEIQILPVTSNLGFDFDIGGVDRLRYPLAQRVTKRVRLLAGN